MRADETVTLTREEYDALIERTAELEDRLAAAEAEGDARVPHEVALAIMGGESPVRAFRNHQGLTLRELSKRSGVALGYLSEIDPRTDPDPMRGSGSRREPAGHGSVPRRNRSSRSGARRRSPAPRATAWRRWSANWGSRNRPTPAGGARTAGCKSPRRSGSRSWRRRTSAGGGWWRIRRWTTRS